MSDSPWVKLVLAMSIDGRIAFTQNKKITLGGEGDRKVLEEALAWADATLIGGQTLRIHENICLIHNKELIEKRKSKKLPSQPITIIASKRKLFREDLSFFNQPLNRWLITDKLVEGDNEKLKGFDKKILIKNNWSETLKILKKYGIFKIALLGGAKLAQSLFIEDNIDELQLTITPKILGGENSLTPFKKDNLPINLHQNNAWILKNVNHLGGNELMVNYIRNREVRLNNII